MTITNEQAMPTISRVDLEPTEGNLIDALRQDILRRNMSVKSFISMLDMVEGGYTFFLDGKWGDGKTFFVNQVALLLKHYNPNLDFAIDGLDGSFIQQTGFSDLPLSCSYLPIYYNAWENDAYPDPLVTLIDRIASEYDEMRWYTKVAVTGEDAAITVLDAILKPFGLDVAKKMYDNLSPKDLRESLKEIREINNSITDMLDSILPERADKLVIFIDELDRCNPAFALKLLEQTKTLLTRENTIIVFSTDLGQLAHTVEGFYGSRYDGEKYLSRFYDHRLTLPPIEQSGYLSKIGFPVGLGVVDKIAHELATSIGFTLRECNRFSQDIQRIQSAAARVTGAYSQFLCAGVIPVLLAIKMNNTEIYQKIIEGNGFSELEEFVKDLPVFNDWLYKCTTLAKSKSAGINPISTTDEERKDFFISVYQETFGNGAKGYRVEMDEFYEMVDLKSLVRKYLSPAYLL